MVSPWWGKYPIWKILSLRSVFIIPQKVQFVKMFAKKTLRITIGPLLTYKLSSKTKSAPTEVNEQFLKNQKIFQ